MTCFVLPGKKTLNGTPAAPSRSILVLQGSVAEYGNHDSRANKIPLNEAWMGQMGPRHTENSHVTDAHKLEGTLFLTVGELKTNVDPASTLQVVDALIKTGKDFDLLIVPGTGHRRGLPTCAGGARISPAVISWASNPVAVDSSKLDFTRKYGRPTHLLG